MDSISSKSSCVSCVSSTARAPRAALIKPPTHMDARVHFRKGDDSGKNLPARGLHSGTHLRFTTTWCTSRMPPPSPPIPHRFIFVFMSSIYVSLTGLPRLLVSISSPYLHVRAFGCVTVVDPSVVRVLGCMGLCCMGFWLRYALQVYLLPHVSLLRCVVCSGTCAEMQTRSRNCSW